MKTKRALQKEATRKKILDTSWQLYEREGFSIPSSTIAAQAGVSHGTIFVHFPTTDQLIMTLLEEFRSAVCNRTHDLALCNGDLKTLLEAHLSIIEEFEDFYYQFLKALHTLPEEAKTVFISIQSAISHHFSQIIADMKVVKEIPQHMLFNTWTGLIHYYILNRDFFAPGKSVISTYKKELVQTFLKLSVNYNPREEL